MKIILKYFRRKLWITKELIIFMENRNSLHRKRKPTNRNMGCTKFIESTEKIEKKKKQQNKSVIRKCKNWRCDEIIYLYTNFELLLQKPSEICLKRVWLNIWLTITGFPSLVRISGIKIYKKNAQPKSIQQFKDGMSFCPLGDLCNMVRSSRHPYSQPENLSFWHGPTVLL